MVQAAAASEAVAGQSTQGKQHHSWWEHSDNSDLVAYLCWNTLLSRSIPKIEKWPYTQAALQRRFERGADVPPWWKPQQASTPLPGLNSEVRINAELARIQVALCLDEGGRIWAALRDAVTRTDSPGWLLKRDLRGLLASYGIDYTRQHLGRILGRYRGIYWNIDPDRKRLYVRKPDFVTKKLIQICFEQGRPELVLTNQPGGKDMYLPTSGSLERWRAYVYAGWLGFRENPTIARSTLEMLFNRDQDSLRRWEETHLADLVQVIEGRAQCGFNAQDIPIPDHAQSYVARVKTGSGAWELTPAIYWRLSNTYHVGSIRQHHRLGQGRKIREAAKQAILAQPIDCKADGMQRTKKVYFATHKSLSSYLKKHGWSKQYRYLFKGENRSGILMFEPRLSTLNPERDTYPNERATHQEAARYHAQRQAQYRAWYSEQGGIATH